MKKCPSCQSSRFRKTEETMHCDKCGYTNKSTNIINNELTKQEKEKLKYNTDLIRHGEAIFKKGRDIKLTEQEAKDTERKRGNTVPTSDKNKVLEVQRLSNSRYSYSK